MLTYAEVLKAIEDGEYDQYTDRMDVSIEISLFEYGIIRNPQNNEVLFYNGNPEPLDDHRISLRHTEISLADVRGYLIDESSKGFFSYIGSSLEKELAELDNNYLAGLIHSINMYDGYFRELY
jgi:hypothetical protein